MKGLKDGFDHIITSIKKQRLLVVLIIILQLGIFLAFAATVVHYQIKILEDVNGVIEPLAEANYNPESIEAGEDFLKDASAVYSSQKSLIRNSRNLMLWLACYFFIFNGVIWVISHRVLHRLNWLATGVKYLAVTCSAALLLIVIGFIALRGSISGGPEMSLPILRNLSYVALLVYFLVLIVLSFINKSWRRIWKLSLESMTNLPLVLLVLIINLVLLAASLGIVYYIFINSENLFLMILVQVLFLMVVVFTRLFWIYSLNKINRQEI
jgi:hypothetical protein